MINLYHGDCLEVMKQIPDGSVDCVITDPPYRVISGGRNDELSKKRRNSPCGILSKNDGKIFEHNNIDFKDWVPEVYRVLKDNSDFYCMTNTMNIFKLNEICTKTGFKLHNILVWEKNNATPNRWYMKNCEYTLYYYKGQANPINELGSKTVHSFTNPNDKNHPTEKPVGLMELYVRNSSNIGDTILDPFMGSGSTGLACKHLNRNFIGIELDDKYFQIAQDRINGELL